jgi:4-hydroxy-tetrahydrodipicolinate reductase
MGKLIEQLAPEYGFTIHARADAGHSPDSLKGSDVAIEFSTPHTALQNIETLAALGIPAVVGTTGWLDHMDRARAAVEKGGAGLVWAANFSIGVNVFLRAVHETARLLANEPAYAAWAWEIHHNTKKDAPSGTLIALVNEIKAAGYQRPVNASSNRAGSHPGTHEIGFDSAADTITLRHTARNREGFARGALKAAQWIPGKKGVFEFKEIL